MGKNVVDASKAVGVKFFVWRSARSFLCGISNVLRFELRKNLSPCSSLPSASKLSKGKYTQVHHFDREYIRVGARFLSKVLVLRSSHRISEKAAVDGYLATSGVPFATVQTGYYLENAWRLDPRKAHYPRHRCSDPY